MNSSLMTYANNSNGTMIESWFIPIDIFMIVCTSCAIVLILILLFVMGIDKKCHTIPMMLVVNSCLSELIFGSTILSMAVFTLENDLKQIQYQDSFCILRAYFLYASCALQYYSYFLQANYRYINVVYSTNIFFQSRRCQILLIGITWIIAFVYPIPFLFNDNIIYDVNNQICQVFLQLSFLVLYMAFCVYTIPILLIMFIYFKLVRYVKQMVQNVKSSNKFLRAKRELKLVQRIVILVFILFTTCFPYKLFVLISFFTRPPIYHFRIAYIFAHVSLMCVIITLLQFTDPLRMSLMKIINGRVVGMQ